MDIHSKARSPGSSAFPLSLTGSIYCAAVSGDNSGAAELINILKQNKYSYV